MSNSVDLPDDWEASRPRQANQSRELNASRDEAQSRPGAHNTKWNGRGAASRAGSSISSVGELPSCSSLLDGGSNRGIGGRISHEGCPDKHEDPEGEDWPFRISRLPAPRDPAERPLD